MARRNWLKTLIYLDHQEALIALDGVDPIITRGLICVSAWQGDEITPFARVGAKTPPAPPIRRGSPGGRNELPEPASRPEGPADAPCAEVCARSRHDPVGRARIAQR